MPGWMSQQEADRLGLGITVTPPPAAGTPQPQVNPTTAPATQSGAPQPATTQTTAPIMGYRAPLAGARRMGGILGFPWGTPYPMGGRVFGPGGITAPAGAQQMQQPQMSFPFQLGNMGLGNYYTPHQPGQAQTGASTVGANFIGGYAPRY